MKNLGDKEVKKAAKTPGVHRVAPGLYLRVKDTGSAFWTLRYTIAGKATEMSLGPYSQHTLQEATAKAGNLRLGIKRDKIDPLAQKQEKEAQEDRKAVSKFRDVAADRIEALRPGWKNEKHADQWTNTLTTHAYPHIGDLDVAEIDTEHVLQVLQPIWTTKHETATRVRQRIEDVLDAARARKLRTGENPARWRGHLDAILTAIPKSQRVQHHPALPWKELPAFMKQLRAKDSNSARALEFTILTCCRTSEVINAHWSEIDGDVWTVPTKRMKSKREHRVPLSKPALELLEKLPRIEGEALLFPSSKVNKPLSTMAMLELLRGVRPGLTVHGFRSTFRDWVSDATSYSPELAEQALAHAIGNEVERAYRRGDLLERRRELMTAWADYCAGKANVLAIAA